MRSRRLVYSYFKSDYKTTKTVIWAFYRVLGVSSMHTQSRAAKHIHLYIIWWPTVPQPGVPSPLFCPWDWDLHTSSQSGARARSLPDF